MTNRNIRSVALLLIIMVSGCRMIVDVDPGGDVTSQSGLSDCSAGNSCIYDIPAGSYNETFTATAADGYRFSGWDGYWCSKTVGASCTVALTPDLTAYEFDTAIAANFTLPIVGSWIEGSPDSADSFALATFYENGGFVITQSCDESEATNPGGGYEQGTYTWDPATGAFNTTVLSDSIGGCGSREADGTLSFNNITVSGDIMTLRSGGPSGGVISTLARIVPGSSDVLTGTWSLGDTRVPDGFAQVTFVGGLFYIVATECSDNNDSLEPLPPGMEYGTYTWNASSKASVFTPIRKTLGDCGLTNPLEPGNDIVRVKYKGRSIKLLEPPGGEKVILQGLF